MVDVKRIGAAHLTVLDRQQRNRRNAAAKAMRHVLGQQWILAGMLRTQLWAVRRGEAGTAGLALHPVWVQQCMGKELLVQVPLARIGYFMADWLQLGSRRVHTSDFFLAHGDLAPARQDIGRLNVLQEVQDLMAVDWDFRRTPAYAHMVDALGRQCPVVRQQVRLDTVDKVDGYFLRFHALYQSVKSHGLLSNQEVSQRLCEPADREIGIALDRDGSLVKLQGGQHRFALAVALGLEKVPVELRMVHAQALVATCRQHSCSPVQAIERLLQRLSCG